MEPGNEARGPVLLTHLDAKKSFAKVLQGFSLLTSRIDSVVFQFQPEVLCKFCTLHICSQNVGI